MVAKYVKQKLNKEDEKRIAKNSAAEHCSHIFSCSQENVTGMFPSSMKAPELVVFKVAEFTRLLRAGNVL